MKKRMSFKAGFTLVEIMIVMAIIGVLMAIAIPNYMKVRTTTQKNTCMNNLRQIDAAKDQWALENKMTLTDTPVDTDLIGTDKFLKVKPTCPANGTYSFNNMSTHTACSVADHTLN